jgi:CHAT domain-containing protein
MAVAPLRPLLTAERLLIVSAGALHSVPLHALWDGERHLLEAYEIAVAPSASIAVIAGEARDRQAGAQRPAHDLTWAGLALADEAIPAARSEVELASRFFDGRARLYLDKDASLAGLHAAAQADILHVATHGLFRSDNPFFSVLKLADGWIDVRQLYRLPLAARLVVLSACESGAGQLRAGDEVIGLARGFLAAGAPSLVASIWHVHDASAARLMERFYAALTAEGPEPVRPAAALRTAQRAAIAEGQHPYFWAPFYIVGE